MASEVERVLTRHPMISECAVFPLPDERFGHAVSCAIVCQNDVSLQEVRDWCETNGLASYKRPRKLFRVNDLPKNSSGKVLKYLLVERFGSSVSQRVNSRL